MLQQIKRIQARLAARPDTEHEQCYLRILTGIIAYCYGALMLTYGNPQYATSYLVITILLFTGVTLGGFGLLAHMIYSPGTNYLRRWIGVVHDMAFCGAGVWAMGDYGLVICVMYVWIVIGNGFRYGQTFLYGSAVLALISLIIASQINPYLREKTDFVVSMSLLLGLVIPLYMGSLLRTVHRNLEAAISADRLKTRFLANVSHDLRTPLNSILAITDMLSTEQVDHSTQLRQIQDMQEAAQSLNGMVNDLLDVAKIEAGRINFENKLFDFPRLLGRIVRAGRTLASNKPIELNLALDPHLPSRVMGDQLRIEQIVSNLVGNAIKYTDAGYIQLYARPLMTNHGQQIGGVILQIKDTGIGLSRDEINRIFMPFVQADDSYVRRTQGAGLGLTIAHDLVKEMGGEIEVLSTKGQGSIFTVTLPLPISNEASDYGETLRKDSNIAVICDSPDRRSVWEDALRNDGWERFGVYSLRASSALLCPPSLHATSCFPMGNTCVVIDCEGLEVPLETARQQVAGPQWCNTNAWIAVNTPELSNLTTDSISKANTFCCRLRSSDLSELAMAVALCRASSADYNLEIGANKAKAAYVANLAGKRILVADDNELNRRILSDMLGLQGLDVTAVSDGEDAWNELCEQHYDIAILDIQMPKLTGIQVMERVRSLKDGGATKLLAFTADTTNECRVEATEAGADAILYKPVRTLDVLAQLSALVTGVIPLSSSEIRASTQPLPADDLLDYELLRQIKLSSNRKDYLASLVSCLNHEGGGLIEEIGQALKNKDAKTTQSLLHRLKGMSASIGAVSLSSACRNAMEYNTEEPRISPSELYDLLSALHKSSVTSLYNFAEK
jgi:two-component system sensor histidine kinase RpfC